MRVDGEEKEKKNVRLMRSEEVAMMKNRCTARKVEAGSKKEWTVKEQCRPT